MRVFFIALVASVAALDATLAEDVIYRSTLSEQSVETRDLSIRLDPVGDDVRFAVTLQNKATGVVKRHAFEGEGANDVSPFQVAFMTYCDTSVILLTVEYPWHHDLPPYRRVLDTFAFRASDFGFIDVTFGPLTDIALADQTAYDPSDVDMLPAIGVRCLPDSRERPFRFFQRRTR